MLLFTCILISGAECNVFFFFNQMMCTLTLLWTMSYLALPLWAALPPPPRMGCIPCSDTTNKRKSDVLSYLIDVIACYLTTSANQTLATTSLAGRWHSSVAGVRAITGCQVSMRGGGFFCHKNSWEEEGGVLTTIVTMVIQFGRAATLPTTYCRTTLYFLVSKATVVRALNRSLHLRRGRAPGSVTQPGAGVGEDGYAALCQLAARPRRRMLLWATSSLPIGVLF